MASHFALFVDLENCGGKKSMLMDVIERVKIRGDILIGKVYGYTDSYSDLKETLLSNTFTVVPSLRYGRNQKNNSDIQLVIDALDVAYRNELIDSFCIVSGDSDYVPLVGKLKSMGKFVLGISRSEVASGIFINACSEFVFLESVAAKQPKKKKQDERQAGVGDLNELIDQVETIVEDQEQQQMYASELKDTLMRLRSDFSERSFGCSTFGKLIALIASKSDKLRSWTEQSSLMIGLNAADAGEKLDKSNWLPAFTAALERFKSEGFDRVKPSILKSTILSDYPGFEEKQIGFKRFSDVMKALEKQGLLVIEMDEQHTMLLKIC